MAKKRMYFDCTCSKRNWLDLDPSQFQKQEIILYCCDCGRTFGRAKKEAIGDGGSACCECIPYQGTGAGITTGPVKGPGKKLTEDTRWGEPSGTEGNKEGITRAEFMKKYCVDPWTQWCGMKDNAKKSICEDFDKRCMNLGPVIPKPLIVVDEPMR